MTNFHEADISIKLWQIIQKWYLSKPCNLFLHISHAKIWGLTDTIKLNENLWILLWREQRREYEGTYFVTSCVFCHTESLFSSQCDNWRTFLWECEVCGEAGIWKHPLGFAQIFVFHCSLQCRISGLLWLTLSLHICGYSISTLEVAGRWFTKYSVTIIVDGTPMPYFSFL